MMTNCICSVAQTLNSDWDQTLDSEHRSREMKKACCKLENRMCTQTMASFCIKKSCIWETKHLSTDADSSTDAIGFYIFMLPKSKAINHGSLFSPL